MTYPKRKCTDESANNVLAVTGHTLFLTFILNKADNWGVNSTKQSIGDVDDAAISMNNLQLGYGRNVVLHDITTTIQTGSCVAITGDNGSGKSTLMKALIGTIPLMGGSVDLLGYTREADEKPSGPKPWNQVGYVPQRGSSSGGVESTVEEVVRSGLLGVGRLRPPRDAKTKVKEAVDSVGLRHRMREPFQVLSGGQQQRALIARALVRSPSLLLFDEPLTGLDKYNRLRLAEILRVYLEGGATALLVLHDLGELTPLIDRELHIASGHIMSDGPPRIEGEKE